jgi:primosomal protein N' (replication factor Y) (superfamily II helicase)
MIADVAFDAPVLHPFSYRVPDGWSIATGQRVAAPLRGAPRVGLVVGVREADDPSLRPLARVVDPAPALDPTQLALVEWIAAESLGSVGSVAAALLPPAAASGGAPSFDADRPGGDAERARGDAPSAISAACAPHPRPELIVGAGRERYLLDVVAAAERPALIITADVDTAARWSRWLARTDRVVRLDSGAADTDRATGWTALAAGRARLAVGTRSALLAPLPPGALIALVDEHDPGHRPPGSPRIHAREVVLERAARGSLRALLTSATPSVELWWRASSGRATLSAAEAAPWPTLTVADTKGILRRQPLTPQLARAVTTALAARRRVLLLVSRVASALACEDCGTVSRCAECGLPLAYSRAAARLTCRLCGATLPLPDTCAACRGRRLSPFGWGIERVEHAVRQRFPRARVARWEAEGRRGARGEAQRQAAAVADVVIGTRGALRLFGPDTLGAVAFVSPDHLLRRPDFRAGERLFEDVWAAAERVRPDGDVIVQSQTPDHYTFQAAARQDLATFYRPELAFRAELGYPPFRRLALITLTGAADAAARLAAAVAGAVAGARALTTYPPVADRGGRTLRLVVKGPPELPRLLAAALADFRGPRTRAHGIMDVEVDPVEWPF